MCSVKTYAVMPIMPTYRIHSGPVFFLRHTDKSLLLLWKLRS